MVGAGLRNSLETIQAIVTLRPLTGYIIPVCFAANLFKEQQ
jgi:hypothetical protein